MAAPDRRSVLYEIYSMRGFVSWLRTARAVRNEKKKHVFFSIFFRKCSYS